MLEYMLEMGPYEQNLARQAYSMRQPLPERIANAPELQSGLELYLESFFDLDSERTDGPIPWSSVVRYAEFYEFDLDQLEELLFYVRHLDAVIMEHRQKKLEEKFKRNKPTATKGKKGIRR